MQPPAHIEFAAWPEEYKEWGKWALLSEQIGRYWESLGQHGLAETAHRKASLLSTEILGPEHLFTLTSMNNLALVLNSQGKCKEAKAINQQTLARYEKVLGTEHPSTLTSMNNLAGVLSSQKKYKEAEEMNWQTLVLREKALGPKHPDTLTSMGNLAWVLSSQNKYKEAEVINRQTLALREKVLGPEHLDTLASVYCLAYFLAKQCNMNESLRLYQRAATGYSLILGEGHPTTLACCQHHAEQTFGNVSQTSLEARVFDVLGSFNYRHNLALLTKNYIAIAASLQACSVWKMLEGCGYAVETLR
ncbi:hypothetical protein COCC4DRAFT_28753 [Bipolaris maydis ATCC 48331]|uniref:MalT-like TPR region domain-containing protein n=2 Tax=Cochliobolus heterostrophus TaxID=5016 RepID=N4WSB5_COCH4|nr:uncharacterized protein COCC4DRAFT_28753 [Bipolaris maydis ATCC 48331]ENH99077.1 hypothetical protein COCC4DRAFT_28753 [Bipolaris maydis ATCC 48331]